MPITRTLSRDPDRYPSITIPMIAVKVHSHARKLHDVQRTLEKLPMATLTEGTDRVVVAAVLELERLRQAILLEADPETHISDK